jgi:ATP-dependent Lon protease
MTLPNAILFPGAMVPLHIFEPKYRTMLKDMLHSHRVFALAMRKGGSKKNEPESIAGVGFIRVAVTKPDSNSFLVLQGLARVALEQTVRSRPYRIHKIRPLVSPVLEPGACDRSVTRIKSLVKKRFDLGLLAGNDTYVDGVSPEQIAVLSQFAVQSSQHFLDYLNQLKDPGMIADLVGCSLLSSPVQRQAILETMDIPSRMQKVELFLKAEIRRIKKQNLD